MILLSNIAFLLVCIFTGAIKSWHRYYNTILYLSLCNFLYNLLCRDHMLWKYHSDLLLNHVNTDLVNTFVMLPTVAMLFLHFLPTSKSKRQKTFYYLAWVLGFSALELTWYLTGYITYAHGWTFFYSVIFYFAMFFALELHHKRVSKALIFSLACTLALILLFKVPVWK